MTANYTLFSNSSTSVALKILYDGYERTRVNMQSQMRTQESGLLSYRWSSFNKYAIQAMWLTTSDMNQLNTWHSSGTNLTFINECGSSVSCRMASDELAFELCKPYTNQYKCKLDLQEY